MKKISRLCAVFFLVSVTGIMLYIAFAYEEQKIQEEYARVAEEQAALEAEAAVLRAAEEAARLEAAKLAEIEDLKKQLENPAYDKDVNIAELKETTNQDIYAWIYIPDSNIDYPILQHPTNNAYYLEYNIDGTKGYPGCIYSENYNNKEFSDPVTVLYGHNMKNGSMFAGLHEFEDGEYFDSHPYIYIYRENDILMYEIFAAYEYNNLHILLNHDFSNRKIFDSYVEKIFTYVGNFKEDVVFTEESSILTLSTCVADKTDKRYLVQGILAEVYDYQR